LQKYQEEAWRDPKVKLRGLDIGDMVLLRSPHTESSRKLESKWVGPYVVMKKPRPRHIAFHILRAGCWSIHRTWTTFIIFFRLNRFVTTEGLMCYEQVFDI
jgi:hypothetical protein